jgi:hypothetical protein
MVGTFARRCARAPAATPPRAAMNPPVARPARLAPLPSPEPGIRRLYPPGARSLWIEPELFVEADQRGRGPALIGILSCFQYGNWIPELLPQAIWGAQIQRTLDPSSSRSANCIVAYFPNCRLGRDRPSVRTRASDVIPRRATQRQASESANLPHRLRLADHS